MKQVIWVISLLLVLGGCREEEQYVHVGERWAALNELDAPEDAMAVDVEGPQAGALGEAVSFNVTPKEDGYLWLLQVDGDDQVALLFPNAMEPDNAVSGGQARTIPGSTNYKMTLEQPTGVQLLAFIVTSQPEGLESVLPAEVRQALADSGARPEVKGVVLDRDVRWGLQKHHLSVR
jgi:hypothetical protein